MSFKTWCFTLNNYEVADEEFLGNLYENGECTFLIYGREVGNEGTPHLQGLFTFSKSFRLRALKNLVGSRYHLEPTRNIAASIEYCKKDGNVCQLGEYGRGRGRRSDLDTICREYQEHRDLNRLKMEHPGAFVKYSRGFSQLLERPGRNWKPYVEWIHGPTGVGKTRSVVLRHRDLWISAGDLRWWDGYIDQSSILLDDFRGDFCKFHTLLRILDRYPYRCEVKGSSVQLVSRNIFITSCYPPDRVYQTREDVSQLLRRIDRIVELSKPGDTVERSMAEYFSDGEESETYDEGTLPVSEFEGGDDRENRDTSNTQATTSDPMAHK